MRTTIIAAITLAVASSALASSHLDAARYYVDTDATATTTTADVASSSSAIAPTAAPPTNRLLDRIKQAAQQDNIDHGPAMANPNIKREVENLVRRYKWNSAWGIGPVIPHKSLDQAPAQPQADIVKRYLQRRIAASVRPDNQDMYRSPDIMPPQDDTPPQASMPTPTQDPTPSSSSTDPTDRDRRIPPELNPSRIIGRRELAEDSYPGPTPQLRRAWQSRRRSLNTLNELD